MDKDLLERAELVKKKLLKQLKNQANVKLIDIGMEFSPDTKQQVVVIRIHLSDPGKIMNFKAEVKLSPQIDGIPIRIISGEYRLE